MNRSGPALVRLQHRLSDAPKALWHNDGKQGQWPLPALVHDLLWHYRLDVNADDLEPFRGKRTHHPWYGTSQLIAWLLMDSAFDAHLANRSHLDDKSPPDNQIHSDTKARVLSTLTLTAEALHSAGRLSQYVEDIDRREEFIRMVLDSLDLRPEGETQAQAQDRLTSISSAERLNLIAASRAAEERARQVREALARKAAEEAADKWTRE